MEIGILGGSFNPIHKGHIGLAKSILEQGFVEEIWLLVSPQNPLKKQTELLEENLRYELALKAVEGEQGIIVSDFEFHLPRPSYTCKTLEALREKFPQHNFTLIIGEDNWKNFHLWANPSDILHYHTLLVYPRMGTTIVIQTKGKAKITTITAPLFPFSSTEVRNAIREKKNVTEMLPFAIISDCVRLYSSDG